MSNEKISNSKMNTVLICLFVLLICGAICEKSNVELLGFPKNTKLLIVNADDYGVCHSCNLGVESALEKGFATGTTLMMPCPWILESLEYLKKRNIYSSAGIHITTNSEYGLYRWKGLTTALNNSLLDGQGYMYRDIAGFGKNAKTEDIIKEIRQQVKFAQDYGLKLSHFDSHMGSLYGFYGFLRLELLALGFALSYETGLPWRIPYIPWVFTEFKKLGFVMIDSLIAGGEPPEREARKKHWMTMIRLIQPGITEILFHPSLYSDELTGIMSETSAKARQYDHDILLDQEVKDLIRAQGIQLISYERLRDLQRRNMNWTSSFRIEDVFEKYKKILWS